MAGTSVFTQPVVGLADVVRLVNRRPLFASKAVFASSADLFITCLHGFSAGGTVDKPVKQVIERASVAFHNRRPAVNDFLYLFPFFRGNNGFMAILNNLPIFTGNKINRTRTDAFLVCPADQMCALVKRVPQNTIDSCAAP